MDIKIPYSLLPKKLIKKHINILIKFSGIISKALPTINQNLSQIYFSVFYYFKIVPVFAALKGGGTTLKQGKRYLTPFPKALLYFA